MNNEEKDKDPRYGEIKRSPGAKSFVAPWRPDEENEDTTEIQIEDSLLIIEDSSGEIDRAATGNSELDAMIKAQLLRQEKSDNARSIIGWDPGDE